MADDVVMNAFGKNDDWPIIPPWVCTCGYVFPEFQVTIEIDLDEPVPITFHVRCPRCKEEWANTGPSERIA